MSVATAILFDSIWFIRIHS